MVVLSLAASLGEDDGDQCMANYARERYWEDADQTFIKFFAARGPERYNCGDSYNYLNVADASTKGTILHLLALAKFIEDFRQASNNHATVYLYYQGGSKEDEAAGATNFVYIFESFVRKFATDEMGSLGISFDVKLKFGPYMKLLDGVFQMKERLKQHNLKFGVTIPYDQEGAVYVDRFMTRADRITVMTYGNYFGLPVNMMTHFLKDTCVYCHSVNYNTLKAKITFIAQGDCEDSSLCPKATMCAYNSDTARTAFRDSGFMPGTAGGSYEVMFYVYELLKYTTDYLRGNVTREKWFDHLFKEQGTRFGISDFKWAGSFYGSQVAKSVGLTQWMNTHAS
ncbi:hypothetical protein FOZ61_003492 [Perkinsus olseni]|uniref:Uncharacterized protein n=1 Tax=Perkinsus olseni TaxID=32597 RepID=A0A7J6LPB4_PEROL|nr:hypothetical protein FOZ61_003492 [Perkinsus olseni]KAF4666353.1 hypothetical protein FOL46_003118 [Perkinsus olseni]